MENADQTWVKKLLDLSKTCEALMSECQILTQCEGQKKRHIILLNSSCACS